ncbi:MAG TPA: hypothetical protein VM580_30515 [Labilithrix sp.]|jgi:hypothetical protein|nr:hypothetical protein [Labilithrix sp.]
MAASSVDRLLRIVAIAIVGVLGACGIALPGSMLLGGAAWLMFLLAALSGWGYIVVRVARVDDPDLGLRAAWGTAGYLAVAGPLVALGIFSAPAILAMIGIGIAGFMWRELLTDTPTLRHGERALRFFREQPGLGVLIVIVALAATVQLLGGVTELDRNQFDDDIIYTPLIRRLLDAGDMIEPFSFRRLAAYGGHTALGALPAARGTLANVHLLDKGIMFAIALLVVLEHARERGTSPLWMVLMVLVVLTMPEIGVNTAAHWSGVALFAALYRTAVRSEWPLVGLAATAICTLRQNYLPVVAVFVVGFLVFRLLAARRRNGDLRTAWGEEGRAWKQVVVVGALSLLPWCIAAYVSSGTFLYPVTEGTWNHELSFRPANVTWLDEIAYVAWACIDTAPIQLTAVLFAVLVVTPDFRPGRPLKALLLAASIGLVLIARSMAEAADPGPVWRYCFGFAVPLTCFLAIEAGRDDEDDVPMQPLARWLVLAALAFQLALSRNTLPKRYAESFDNLREAIAIGKHGDPTAHREQRRYAAMQASIPEGAKVAVMLDEPGYLNFARNEIANLDTVGFASPGTQLPMFVGAEPIRAYLLDEGYRYAAFVREDRSRTYYRRGYWISRYFTDDNRFYQMMSAYQLAGVEAFAELATTTKVIYDADGLLVLDLAAPLRQASSSSMSADEPTRRSAFLADVARREGLLDAWSLTARGDLEILDGVSALQFYEPGSADPAWFEIVRTPSEKPLRGVPMRGLNRRAHLRVRGIGAMRLALRVSVSLNSTFTRPQLDVSLDGGLIATAVADDRGRYSIEVVTPQLEDGWHDVYLVFSSVFDPGRDGRDPRVARLESIEWVPAP